MSFSKRFDLLESSMWSTMHACLFSSAHESAEIELHQQVDFVLGVMSPSSHSKPIFFDLPLVHANHFDFWASDLALISSPPFVSCDRTSFNLQKISNRIAVLEEAFERAIGPRNEAKNVARDRKFKWTAEIKGSKGEESDRKYKVVAETKAGGERRVKWRTDAKGTGRYTFETSTALSKATCTDKDSEKAKKAEKKKKKKKGSESSSRLVEIEDDQKNPGAIAIRRAFAKKTSSSFKGKRKEMSVVDAAVLIQLSFRAHLVRRSQIVRGLRELAVAKSKLKEIRSLFNNLSYRRRIHRDAEERQKFTEKIIVLLLTVEAIDGVDYMTRSAKKSIIEELEIKLELIDPQPDGKYSSLRRRFDLPEDGCIARKIAGNVVQVVGLIDEHGGHGSASDNSE